MKLSAFALIFLCCFSLNTFAYEEKFGAKLKAVYVNHTNLALIQVEGVSGWLKLGDTDNSDTKSMLGIALAAKTAEMNNIWVRWEPVTSGYPQVTILSMGY